MRLITCLHQGRRTLGSWIEDDRLFVDLRLAAETGGRMDSSSFESMLSLIEGGAEVWARARALTASPPPGSVFQTKECRLLAPLVAPPQVRDFLCFEGHLIAAQKGLATIVARRDADPVKKLKEIEEKNQWPIPPIWYEKPIYYTANRLSISAPGDDIVRPAYSKLFDFELEFAAVIGKRGRDISKGAAREHIFGYTIYNDWSARDEQTLVMPGMLGPGKSKDFDQGVTLGPCIVTTDELTDPYALTMKAYVNGAEWSSGLSGTMYHRFEDCIADVSRGQTLYPGEIIGSGTVAGGCGLEHLRFLQDGDVVELHVSGIGTLRNQVIGPASAA